MSVEITAMTNYDFEAAERSITNIAILPDIVNSITNLNARVTHLEKIHDRLALAVLGVLLVLAIIWFLTNGFLNLYAKKHRNPFA